ncbi:MAG: OmpH family outer membrane protein [Paracoccaceae bacterium]
MRKWAVIAALSVLPAPVSAQQVAPDAPPEAAASVLIIDRDRLYNDSRRGQAIEASIQSDALALQAENDRIQAQLIEEERSLTERRPDMSMSAFRAEAEAFDEKVQDIRAAQDSKLAELEQRSQAQRDQFFNDVREVVGQLMLDRGGVVILDRRLVYLASGAVDVTSDAIARIDAETDNQAD